MSDFLGNSSAERLQISTLKEQMLPIDRKLALPIVIRKAGFEPFAVPTGKALLRLVGEEGGLSLIGTQLDDCRHGNQEQRCPSAVPRVTAG